MAFGNSAAGRSLASDFDGQVRQFFKNLDRRLQKAGGKLGDMTTLRRQVGL